MELNRFCESIRNLGNFFGKHLTEDQTELYFNELKYIQKDSFDHAIRAIMKGRKPNPGNFPTIEEFQAICPKQQCDITYNSDESEMDYYHRITITELWEAYNILDKNGHEQFLRFCRAKNISADDIERVEWKHKYGITGGKIMKKLANERKSN